MPAYKDETIQYHRERVREALVLNPRASIREIVELLQYGIKPITLDREYVGKLIKKIRGERRFRVDKENIKTRIAEMQDRAELVIAQMWKIILAQNSDPKAKTQAAQIILKAEAELFNAQMDAGVFDRKIGTIGIAATVEHQHTLPPELKAQILRAFENYGLIKPVTYTTKPDPVLPTPATATAG